MNNELNFNTFYLEKILDYGLSSFFTWRDIASTIMPIIMLNKIKAFKIKKVTKYTQANG